MVSHLSATPGTPNPQELWFWKDGAVPCESINSIGKEGGKVEEQKLPSPT
jgi:hypothetical protein